MLNINFVPDDYIQDNESRRTNLMYLILFAMVMAGLAGAFATIKIRQHAIAAKEKLLNERMAKAEDSIVQFEQLQEKRKEMMKTALTTASLFEPVQRSVILASITNNLPPGTSLLKLEVKQEEPKKTTTHRRTKASKNTKFQQAKNENNAQEEISPEKLLETKISIEGMAPSDLQVAAFIENLGSSALFENVALVESREEKNTDESKYRKFKLTAMLKKEVHLTTSDIEYIREKCKKSAYKL
jgi:Tfp pilus assembly protein PilN